MNELRYDTTYPMVLYRVKATVYQRENLWYPAVHLYTYNWNKGIWNHGWEWSRGTEYGVSFELEGDALRAAQHFAKTELEMIKRSSERFVKEQLKP